MPHGDTIPEAGRGCKAIGGRISEFIPISRRAVISAGMDGNCAAIIAAFPALGEPREVKAQWLAAWVESGYRGACAAVGVEVWVPAQWTQRDPAFKSARAAAEGIAADLAEDRLRALADGTDAASAAQVNALTLRLRGLRPERYGNAVQRVEVTGAGGGALRIEDGNASRAVELLTRFAAAARLHAGAERPALPAPEDDA